MTPNLLPEYLVDEATIVAAHDEMIARDNDLMAHLALVNGALDCLSRLPVAHVESDPDELALLRQAVRCFNSGASSLRLVRCGYFQPALTMVRDLIEVYFLLDLFTRERSALSDWRTMPKAERKKHFKPVRVRERLDEIDGYTDMRRAHTYNLFSEHAAHIDPEGHHIISPDNLTQIGPFPDKGRLKAVLEELATHLGYATVIVCNSFDTEEAEVVHIKAAFLELLAAWQKRYLG